MIVRILGEGQFELSDEAVPALNELRRRPRGGRRGRRRGRLRRRARRAARRVRTQGTPLPVDSLDESDAILPPADASIAEVRELLSDDGLIPG